MKIKDLIQKAIAEGQAIRVETQGDKEGAFLKDRGEFIPWDDLGYSSELGFFSVSDFPFMENEAE
jgi:hypothetical protein